MEMNILKETQAEMKRAGNFERVFPSEYSFIFRQFFEEERPLNYLVSGEIAKMRKNAARSAAPAMTGNVYKQSLAPMMKNKRKKRSAQYGGPGSKILDKMYCSGKVYKL